MKFVRSTVPELRSKTCKQTSNHVCWFIVHTTSISGHSVNFSAAPSKDDVESGGAVCSKFLLLHGAGQWRNFKRVVEQTLSI